MVKTILFLERELFARVFMPGVQAHEEFELVTADMADECTERVWNGNRH